MRLVFLILLCGDFETNQGSKKILKYFRQVDCLVSVILGAYCQNFLKRKGNQVLKVSSVGVQVHLDLVHVTLGIFFRVFQL